MIGKLRAPGNRIARVLQQTHLSLNGYVRKQEGFLRLCEKGEVPAQQ
jgi:hypothetical protein